MDVCVSTKESWGCSIQVPLEPFTLTSKERFSIIAPGASSKCKSPSAIWPLLGSAPTASMRNQPVSLYPPEPHSDM